MRKFLLVLVLVSGCGGGDKDTLTVYLKQRLGPEGPPGQIVPALAPVKREQRGHIPPQRQAILDLRVGPSPDERAQGFIDTLEPETRLRSVTIRGRAATVHLTGDEPDVYGVAAIVYSLTAMPGVERVSLQLDAEPCCAYRHDGSVAPFLTRHAYAGWQGEPCGERDRPDAVRCRG